MVAKKSKTTLDKITYLCVEEQEDEIANILGMVQQILVENGLIANTG